MSINDELILSKWLQVSWCGRLTKEQLRFDNEQKVIEQKYHHVLGSSNLEMIKNDIGISFVLSAFNSECSIERMGADQATCV